jgi:hypothetical protein
MYESILSSKKSKTKEKPRKLLPGEMPSAVHTEPTADEIKLNKLLLEEMSGLADQFVSNGELDIYQETYERLKSKLDRLQTSVRSNLADSNFDMYSDADITASVTNPTVSTKHENNGRQKEIISIRTHPCEKCITYFSHINCPLGIHKR